MPFVHPYPADIVLLHNFEGTFTPDVGEPFGVDGCTLQEPGIFGPSLRGGSLTPGGGGPSCLYLATPSTTYDMTGSDFTIEGWMRLDSSPFTPFWVASIRQPAVGTEFGLLVNGNGAGGSSDLQALVPKGMLFGMVESWLDITGATVAIGAPAQHLALTREGNLYRLFRNGQLVYQRASSFRLAAGPREVIIANHRRPANEGLHGLLDGVCITKRCLYSAAFTPAGPYQLLGAPPAAAPAAAPACQVWPAGTPQ